MKKKRVFYFHWQKETNFFHYFCLILQYNIFLYIFVNVIKKLRFSYIDERFRLMIVKMLKIHICMKKTKFKKTRLVVFFIKKYILWKENIFFLSASLPFYLIIHGIHSGHSWSRSNLIRINAIPWYRSTIE